jgi:hypothetical protein
MQTRSKILMLSGVALLVPALLLAQAAEKHLRHGGALVRHVIKQLDLTPDQVQQVKTIFANNKADLTTELTALKTARGSSSTPSTPTPRTTPRSRPPPPPSGRPRGTSG